MFYQLINVFTKHHSVLTETIIRSEPRIILKNDNDFPEIVNRLITFGLNEEVKLEDVLVSTFGHETIRDKRYVKINEDCTYFSVKNLLKSEYTKQIELRIGKIDIFDIKCLETRCLKKLNENLKNIHEESRCDSIKYHFHLLYQSLKNEDLWCLLADKNFLEKLSKVEMDSEEEVKKIIYPKTCKIFIESFKQKVKEIIENKYKDEILYVTDNKAEGKLTITDPKVYKYRLHMNTDFWPHVEEFLLKEYENNSFQILENKETKKDFVFRIIKYVYNSIVNRRGKQVPGKYIYCLLSKQNPLKTLNENILNIDLKALIADIFNSINLSKFIDSIKGNYSILVNTIFKVPRVMSPIPYSDLNNFKDFQAKIEKYKNISKKTRSEEIKNAINNFEKCLESYVKSNKSFEEETRIFNILKDESIAFNFEIIFRDTNDNIQTIFSKYYFVKEHSLNEIDEIPTNSSPKGLYEPKKKTGIFKNPWF